MTTFRTPNQQQCGRRAAAGQEALEILSHLEDRRATWASRSFFCSSCHCLLRSCRVRLGASLEEGVLCIDQSFKTPSCDDADNTCSFLTGQRIARVRTFCIHALEPAMEHLTRRTSHGHPETKLSDCTYASPKLFPTSSGRIALINVVKHQILLATLNRICRTAAKRKSRTVSSWFIHARPETAASENLTRRHFFAGFSGRAAVFHKTVSNRGPLRSKSA